MAHEFMDFLLILQNFQIENGGLSKLTVQDFLLNMLPFPIEQLPGHNEDPAPPLSHPITRFEKKMQSKWGRFPYKHNKTH